MTYGLVFAAFVAFALAVAKLDAWAEARDGYPERVR